MHAGKALSNLHLHCTCERASTMLIHFWVTVEGRHQQKSIWAFLVCFLKECMEVYHHHQLSLHSYRQRCLRCLSPTLVWHFVFKAKWHPEHLACLHECRNCSRISADCVDGWAKFASWTTERNVLFFLEKKNVADTCPFLFHTISPASLRASPPHPLTPIWSTGLTAGG